MPVNVRPDDIVDNLNSMGYSAKHFHRDAEGDKRAMNAVYIDTGTNKVKAYIDLAGEAPAFKVWAEYPDGHRTGPLDNKSAPLHGDDLKRHNYREADRVRQELTPAALAAYSVAAEGGDLRAIHEGFGLAPPHDRYKPKANRDATAEAEPAAASAPSTAPGL